MKKVQTIKILFGILTLFMLCLLNTSNCKAAILIETLTSDLRFTILMNDRGCPTCRFPLIANIGSFLNNEYKNADLRFVFNSADTAIIGKFRKELDKSVKLLTGNEAKVIYDYYLSEQIGDTYIMMEDENDNIYLL